MNRPIQSRHPLGLFLHQYSACQDVRTKRRAGMLAVGGLPPRQARVRPVPDLRKTRASGLRKTPPTRPRTARPSWPCCVRGRDRSATESVHGIPFVCATSFVFTESPGRRVCNLLESRLARSLLLESRLARPGLLEMRLARVNLTESRFTRLTKRKTSRFTLAKRKTDRNSLTRRDSGRSLPRQTQKRQKTWWPAREKPFFLLSGLTSEINNPKGRPKLSAQ